MASSVVLGGGGGERGKGGGGGGGEVDLRKMSLSRQHAKDISEYTKQLLAKERELESLRTRLSKVSLSSFFNSQLSSALHATLIVLRMCSIRW